MSMEISKTESPTLGALTKLDEILQQQLVQVQAETAPGTFWIFDTENQEYKVDRSQEEYDVEVGTSMSILPLPEFRP